MSFTFTQAQIDALRALVAGRVPLNAGTKYDDVYKLLVSYIDNSTDPDVNTIEVFLRGATQVNAGIGMFSELIRAYTERELELRGAAPLTPAAMAALLQKASNSIADSIVTDILNTGVLPTIDNIAFKDASAAVLQFFQPNLPPTDSAATSVAAGWAGTPFFSQFNDPQMWRLLSAGETGAINTYSMNRLEDLKNVLLAFDSMRFGLHAQTFSGLVASLGSDKSVFLNTFGEAVKTALGAIAGTIGGSNVSAARGYEIAAGLVLTAFAKTSPALSDLFAAMGRLGQANVLDEIRGTFDGQVHYGTTLDSFLAQAQVFFSGISIGDQQAFGAESLVGLSVDQLVAKALTADKYRNALKSLSNFALDLPSFAGRNLDVYSSSTGSGSLTKQWMVDRARMLLLRDVYDSRAATYGTPIFAASPSDSVGYASDVRMEDRSSGLILDINGTGHSAPKSLVVFGSDNADAGALALNGGSGADRLYGGGGNDELTGGDGADYLEGDDGNDVLTGGIGNDTLVGGAGNDILVGGGDVTSAFGGAGNDTYRHFTGDGLLEITDTLDSNLISINLSDRNYVLGVAALTQVSGSTDAWTDSHNNHFSLSGGILSVSLEDGGQIRINNFTSGDFGITLAGPAAVNPTGATFNVGAPDQTHTYPQIVNGNTAPLIAEIQAVGMYGTYARTWWSPGAYLHSGGPEIINVSASPNDPPGATYTTAKTYGGMGDSYITGDDGMNYIVDDSQSYWYSNTVDAYSTWQLGGPTTKGLYPISNQIALGIWGDYYNMAPVMGNDVIDAGGGNDIVITSGGDDTVHGGAGDDYLWDDQSGFEARPTQSYTYNGITAQGISYIYGHDTEWLHQTGHSSNDKMFGDDGNDYLWAHGGNQTMDGGTGNDTLVAGAGNDTLLGGAGDDVMAGDVHWDGTQYLSDTVEYGTDVLDGGDGNDRMYGGGGDDVLIGGAGDDTIHGDLKGSPTVADDPDSIAGNDNISGGSGADTLFGDAGDDVIDGGADTDTIDGGAGNDLVDGGDGADVIHGDSTTSLQGNDELYGGAGDDTVYGDGGDDTVSGDAGADTLYGGDGNDSLSGGTENDVLYGENGDDSLSGGDGHDELYGGSGNDELIADAGSDVLQGGAGNDTYVLSAGAGQVSVTDTDGYNNLWFDASVDISAIKMRMTGGQVVIDFSATDSVVMDAATLLAMGPIALGSDQVDNLSIDALKATFQPAVIADGSLHLANGVNVADVTYTAVNDDLVLIYSGAASSWIDTTTLASRNVLFTETPGSNYGGAAGSKALVLNNWYRAAAGSYVTSLSDGVGGSASLTTVAAATTRKFIGSAAADELNATEGNDQLFGMAGSDLLDAKGGNDYLAGGTGDDILMGGDGNDTYGYAPGDGTDTIIDSAGTSDFLIFSGGINAANVSISEDSTGLTVHLVGAPTDSILIANQSATGGQSRPIDYIQFSDGTVWNSAAIDSHLNHAPVVSTPIADQYAHSGGSYALVVNNFTDPDAGDVLSYAATLTNGQALPAWLVFDGSTRTLSGTPPTGSEGVIAIAVSATDAGGLTTSTAFNLTVAAPQQATPGNDVLTGTASDDVIDALAGDDIVYGMAGNDTLSGSPGNDVLDGGAGTDTLIGGTGDDTFIVDSPLDAVVENPGEGTDTVQSSVNFTLAANVENLLLTGFAAATGTGNALNNTLTGNSASNTLDGGAGADTLVGAAGDDTYVVDNPGDVLVENASEGIDTVQSSVTWVLGANFENLTLTGTSAINATGTALANTLRGNAGDNILDGGAGADTMYGGAGNDTYVVDVSTDVVFENASEGTDTVQSSVNYTLGANIENLTLTGSTATTGTGNTLANVIVGNSASNILDGGAGADTLSGGAGDDTYYVDNVGDVVVESPSQGSDTVVSSISYTLGNDVESLTLAGAAAINGTGNSLDNTLTGNSADNVLSAGVGNDTISAGAGNDTISGGTGNDSLTGGTGNNTYLFARGDGQDVINAFSDSTAGKLNTLQFAAGILPSDITLSRNNYYDLVVGIAGTTDTVTIKNNYDPTTNPIQQLKFSDGTTLSVSYAMAASDTNLSMAAVSAISAVGNSNVNTITGTIYSDIIDGGVGADTLAGGLGNDTYIVDTVRSNFFWDSSPELWNFLDTVTENAGEGTDTIIARNVYSATLSANVENLIVQGLLSFSVSFNATQDVRRKFTGNALNNVIDGSAATGGSVGGSTIMSDGTPLGIPLNETVIDGGAGADTMIGPSTITRFVVDNPGDVIVSNSATTRVDSSISYTLAPTFSDLTLIGTAAISGTGNALANTMDGAHNTAANVLTGGAGNDRYAVGAGDTIVENANEGIDSVYSMTSYTLSANVENLYLSGSSSGLNGFGNASDNIIVGTQNAVIDSVGNNYIVGGGGNDTLQGMGGSDTYADIDVNTGMDTILDSAGTADKIQSVVNSNFNIDSMQFSRSGNDLIMAVDGLNGVKVQNWYASGSNVIEKLSINNNGLWFDYTSAQVQNRADGINSAPVAGASLFAQNATTGTAFSYQFDLNAFLDIESQHSLTYAATLADGSALPTWLAFNSTTRTFTGTPPSNAAGSLSVKVTATDTGGLAANSTFAVSIAQGPMVGTPGNDILNGDASDNTIDGLAGDDVINGLDGNDWLEGNLGNDTLNGGNGVDLLTDNYGGNDTLDGGAGADEMYGGTGNDIYIVDNVGDYIEENVGEGIDEVRSSVTYTLLADASFGEIEKLTLTGTTAINGTGNMFDNIITGNSGNNTLTGLLGNDTLDGGTAGTDVLIGGVGNDTYIVGRSTGITITENAGEGTDTINASVTYTLGTNLENLTLTGTSAINGTGNTLANVITGNSGANTLDGGTGADTLIGGAGNDIYTVDNTGDVVTENAGEGTDQVNASATYTLGNNVENLTLTGTTAINGTGNTGDNVLTGNSGNNTLTGLAGNDTLDAGTAGTDVLVGGLGNDSYVIGRTTGITITENAGEGTDLVNASVTYTLGTNLENLTLTGSTAINGTGNTGDNVLTGNSGNNTLTGLAGNDTLDAGTAGTDVLVGGVGNDTYIVGRTTGITITENASEGTDLVNASVTYTLGTNLENLTLTGTSAINGTGNTVANVITGNSGANTLDGGTGADTLIGGAGNDIYTVDNTGDIVTENASEGTDLVNASVTYTISNNVENLTLSGTTAINGTGNTGDNVLTGNSGNNTLTGLAGNDTLDAGTAGTDVLVGGLGNDTYLVGTRTSGITITENAGEGTDTVSAGITYTLGTNLENLLLTGSTAINGTGNTADNVLTGNSGNNTLTGLAGNDTLDGGSAGTDVLVGGTGNDTYIVNRTTGLTLTEAANEGIDSVSASVTQTLGANIEALFLTGSTAINGTGNTLANLLRGNTGINTLAGGGGTDILEGDAGNDILSNTSGNTLLDGGAGNDTLTGTANNDLLIGGVGNDALTTGQGADIIAFNKGDGVDTVAASTTTDNTLSIGGGALYADLVFQKSGNDLILKVGATDQITFTGYYTGSNRSVTNLQVIIEGTSDYNAGSGTAMNNKKVETFNFGGLVAAFDAALVANPSLTSWSLTNSLAAQYLSGSDTAALGGDLAYQYARNGNLSNISFTPALALLGAAGFGTTSQTLQPIANLQDTSPRLS